MTVTRKGQIDEVLDACYPSLQDGTAAFAASVVDKLLQLKVKFPLLEYAACCVSEKLPADQHLPFCDAIAAAQTEGGNVVLGIMLQRRLAAHREEAWTKAAEYIAAGEEWYVSDLIGERVFGYSLRYEPAPTLKAFHQLKQHDSFWVVRSLGAGSHWAIKKGLEAKHVTKVFAFLLSLSNAKEHQVKTGIGWAAKTTAKFHPSIIAQNEEALAATSVGNWFRKKVAIGLERHQHFQGNP